MIFVDSNIPMYAAGQPCAQKEACLGFLQRIQGEGLRAASSAEVLQEILHRYRAIARLQDGFKVYDLFRALSLHWLEVVPSDVDYAKTLLGNHEQISSRDALHVAVMHRHKINRIVTYDRGFLGLPEVRVYLPEQVP